MDDLVDVTKFNASASCSKCTVRRRNEPISDRTTMQFLLNGQFALNAKSQKENEQKGEKQEKRKEQQKRSSKAQNKKYEKRTNRCIYNFRLKLKAL